MYVLNINNFKVEKTSKRGGRIIHEKELAAAAAAAAVAFPSAVAIPGVGVLAGQPAADNLEDEPTITEIMKNPSKVIISLTQFFFHFVTKVKVYVV